MIEDKEQSETWGGFRVARRAKIIFLQENQNNLVAIHDGYQRIKSQHQRTFFFEKNAIEIEDEIKGGKTAKAFLHFYPDVKIKIRDSKIYGDFGIIEFENQDKIHLEKYKYAKGFNQLLPAQKVVIKFKKHLSTKITFI